MYSVKTREWRVVHSIQTAQTTMYRVRLERASGNKTKCVTKSHTTSLDVGQMVVRVAGYAVSAEGCARV